jgi:hypothetical protein
MTPSGRFLEYNSFWKKISTELWMIEKLNQDFGLWDLGLPLVDPARARRTSQKMLAHMTKEAFNTVRYLTPWIFVATYKVLEVIHESTKTKLPATFQKYPVLLEVSETLRESFRRARNKIVHLGKCGIWAFPYREKGKTFYDNCLVVFDEHRKRVIKISLYDMTFAGFLVSCLAAAIRHRRIRGSDLELVYDQIQALRLGGWIKEELFLKVEESCKGLKVRS